MITINALFRFIVLAKRQGKGRLGNGVILTKLIGTLCDFEDDTAEIQRRLTISPDNVNLNRYADRLMQDGVRFPSPDAPYGLSLTKFEGLVHSTDPDGSAYLHYLNRMHQFCMDVLDPEKVPLLTHTLLHTMRTDNDMQLVFYQCRFLPKAELLGDPAHPKRICLEALLVGLLYHAMRSERSEDTHLLQLLSMPKFANFSAFLLDNKPELTTASLAQLLDLKHPVSLEERLLHVLPEITDASLFYPMELRIKDRLRPTEALRELRNHVFLTADGAMGKSTLLRQQTGLYLPLYRYKKEIRERLLPGCSSYLLTQILLKYYYRDAYATWEACEACESEKTPAQVFTELLRFLSQDTPRITLLLDGTNEIPSGQLDAFAEEVSWILQYCPCVRLMVSGRTIPDYPFFQTFESVILLGISNTVRDAVLAEQQMLPTDASLLELLRSPLFLRLFLSNRGEGQFTRGEILDTYFRNWESPVSDNSKLLLFAVQFLLPFAANAMLHHHRELTRADLSDAMKSASELFLDEERIYQNCIAPLHFRKADLLQAKENTDIVSLVIDHTGLIESDANGQLRFSHQYYRDCFAAKYILNLIEALVKGYGDNHPEEQNRLFEKYGLGEIWFWGDDSDKIYRLIGEICGDAKNIPDETGLYYQETLLDDLLDMARQFPHFRMVENVMLVMHLNRNGLVCGVDFSGLNLPFTMPEGTYFSDHGM
nr:hypothetical protein [Oscillospiraceae bacterium]